MTQQPNPQPAADPDQAPQYSSFSPPGWTSAAGATEDPSLSGSGRPSQPGHSTEPLWYGQTSPLPTSATGSWAANPTPGVATAERPQSGAPVKQRRFVEVVGASLLAAVLASGATYAVTHDNDQVATATSSTPLGSPNAPVVQAAPNAPDWTATAAAVSPSVVAITVTAGQSGGQGSGVIIDTVGHIVTNNHVVSLGSGATITVTLNDKRTYAASVVGTDPSTDLAVVKLDAPPKDLKAIAFGDASKLKVGDPVMAVGNPLGLAGTVTTGIVSALNRPVSTQASTQADPNNPFGQAQGEPVVTNAVQTSAAINPGNSGGALVDGSGRLVGINSAIASLGSSGSSSQSGNIGIGFAIPVNEARSIAQQLISSGKAQHAYLGVSSDDGTVAEGSAKRAAAVLKQILPGTAADKAGLQVGDAVVAVDGDIVDSALSFTAQIREREVGAKTVLTIVRKGKTQDVSVTLGKRTTTAP